MKALSLLQPWASLVAVGAKRIETRSWATRYRGPLAIHASKRFPKSTREVLPLNTFQDALFGQDGCYNSVFDLPLGAVIAICRLVECCIIAESGLYRMVPGLKDPPQWFTALPGEPECSFGNYAPDRFAWILEDVVMLPQPVLAKGQLGLWEWKGGSAHGAN